VTTAPSRRTSWPAALLERAARIRLVSFDVDGVLTDGKLYYTDTGGEMKAFNVQDGSAIKLIREHDIEVAIITGRDSPMVARRARELGIRHFEQGVADKAIAMNELRRRLGLEAEAVAHVGDDLPDLPLFEAIGLAVSVPNGHPVARAAAHYVTELPGGGGVAREICELLLTAQHRWPYD
jgi:3-deoxy-D-manno-octulosonate 8-phosphate phosphatase (KDO 8-P phosphatase)